ncbi:hypothetical protein LCGC14_2930580, partial [marine sediment metagenome]
SKEIPLGDGINGQRTIARSHSDS